METLDTIYFKSSIAGSEFIETLISEDIEAGEGSDKKWARCRNCHYKIALISDKININHADNHIFKNPAGIFYRVICFQNAPGSRDISDYTDENSWFSGYSWSISLCRSCNHHLGWHYNSGSGEFYGLIADRLTGI